MFPIEIQTAGHISTKFGTHVFLEGKKILGGFNPVPLTPCQDLRWAKGGPVGFWSLSLAFWQKVLNTKVAEHPQISRGGSSCWIRIRIRKDLGLVWFWNCGHLYWRVVYKIKTVIYVQNSFLVRLDPKIIPPNSAWLQGQGNGMERHAGTWRANVWLCQYNLVIKWNLTINTL